MLNKQCLIPSEVKNYNISMRIDWKTVGRCVSRTFARLESDTSKRLENLRHIAVDETSYKKGHSYITVVINQENNQAVWVHDGHRKEVFTEFLELLTQEQRERIETISGDEAKWIDLCCEKYLPNAKRCIDLFMSLLGQVKQLMLLVEELATNYVKRSLTLLDCPPVIIVLDTKFPTLPSWTAVVLKRFG